MSELLQGLVTDYQPTDYPWFMIDGITDITPGERLHAYKMITANEGVGVFGGTVPVPSLTFLETEIFIGASVILLETLPELKGLETRDYEWNVNVLGTLAIGECFDVEANVLSWRRGIAKIQCKGTVNGELRCEGVIGLAIPDVMNQYLIKK